MKKHIPNFLTCCNLMTGAVGIAVIMQGGIATVAIYFVLIAAVFDFLDGLFARVLKAQSEFGKQLDSLADLVSFGVLPSLALTTIDSIDGMVKSAIIASLLVVPFSALRLAKFNVSDNQGDEFRGLPTPANAILLTGFIFGYQNFWSYVSQEFYWLLQTEGLTIFPVISCFLLVSNIRMIAFKFKSMSWSGNELRYLLLGMLVTGFAVFQLSFIPFVIPAYIVFSIVGNYFLKPIVFK